jgi:hypothetical protein
MKDEERRMFKELTPDNWTEQDPVMRNFAIIDHVTGPRPATAEDWARSFLKLELPPSLPRNVRELFEVARGTGLYGWFFYPLYQIAEAQLFRVLDAAVAARCKQAGGPAATTSLAARISWLIKRGVIPESERVRWDAWRNLRNFTSHPEMQPITPPGSVLGSFQLATRLITELFEPAAA